LYAFDGSSLQSWERILQHLPNQVVSRPVYENEEDVIASIRSKSNRINEAYASIYVDPQYILPQPAEKIPVDKLGKPLLALKDKAINLDNVDVFVHQSGTYRFASGRLIKK
jgi:intracellular multiplication protein IcmQ